jgi:hypothetical protein
MPSDLICQVDHQPSADNHENDGSTCQELPSRLKSHDIAILEASSSGVKDDGIFGLPYCVAELVMCSLDPEGKRVLRAVNRQLYFEASKRIRRLVVQQDNLETLILMPLHQVRLFCRPLVVHV